MRRSITSNGTIFHNRSASKRSSLARSISSLFVGGLTFAFAADVQAAPVTWTGATETWNTGTNWSSTPNLPLTGDTLIFGNAGAGGTTLNNDLTSSSFNIAGLTFNAGGSAFTINGNAFALTGPVLNSSSNLQTINTDIGLATVQTFTTGSGGITLGGVISGAGGIAKAAGAGTLILGGDNTFTGAITFPGGNVAAGNIRLTSNNALGAAGTTKTISVNTSGNAASGAIELSGGITVPNNKHLNLSGRTISVSASHLRNVSGNNVWGGNISIAATGGSYGIDNQAGTLTLSGTLTNAVTSTAGTRVLSLFGAGNYVINGSLTTNTNQIGINMLGTGSLTLAPTAFTSTGGVTLTSGTLNLNNAVALGGTAGTLVISGGTLDSTATFTNQLLTTNNPQTWNANFAFTGTNSLNLGTGAVSLGTNAGPNRTVTVNANTLTVGGAISDGTNATPVTSIIKVGAGTLALSGANLYTGVTTVNAGILTIGNNAALGTTGANTVVASGAQVFVNNNNRSTAEPFNVAGDGVTSTGAIRVGGNATGVVFSGPVTLAANAEFQLDGNTGSTFSGGIDVGANTLTFDVGGSATSTVSTNPIIGTGSLVKNTGGTLNLNAANTYSGSTTISGGTLGLTGAGDINASSGITINGGMLLQASSVAVTPVVTVTLGTLTGNGTVNTANIANDAGAIVSNNNGVAGAPLTVGTLTFAGAGTINTFSTNTAAPIVTTTLASNAAGTVTINATNASWTIGTPYDLVSYTGGSIGGAGFGQFVLGTVTGATPRQTKTLANSGTAITLTVGANDIPYWTGAASINWNTTETNWKLSSNNANTQFLANDSVLFNDNGTKTTINIDAADVTTTSVTFDNTTAVPYAINSTGVFKIASGSLTKNNTGTVTLSTANTYAGGTTINGGTLVLTGAGAIGATPNVTIATGAMLRYNDMTAASTTLTGTVSGSGTLAVAGTGTANSGLNIYVNSASLTGFTGNIDIQGARLQAATQTGLGGTTAISAINGGQLLASGAVTYTTPLTISGTGWIQENQVTIGGPLGALRLGNNSTYSGDITLSGNASITAYSATSTITGNIGENGGARTLTLGGSNLNALSTLTLNPTTANNYTGGTVIDRAVVTANSSSALGTGPITLQTTGVNTGLATRLNLADTVNIANAITLAGPSIFGVGGQGILAGPATGTGTISGPITINANATAGGHINGGNATGGLVLSGQITATVPINQRVNRVAYSGSGSTFATVVASGVGNFIQTGSTVIGANNGLATNAVIDLAGSGAGTVDLNGFNQEVAGLVRTSASAATVTNSSLTSSTLIINVPATFAQTFPGTITANMGLTKSGAGTQTLSGANSFTGATTVSAGKLTIAGAGTINTSSGVTINGATANFNYNSSAALTAPVTLTAGTISGTGAINSAITVGAGASQSPGNSPGNQTFGGGLTWGNGGTYTWEVNSWTNTPVAGTNFDQLQVTAGGLNIGSLTAGSFPTNTFKIDINGLTAGNAVGAVPGFDNTQARSWTILTSNAITGTFNANLFTLDTTNFATANPLGGGSFSLANVGNDLVLNFNVATSGNPSLAAAVTAGSATFGGVLKNGSVASAGITLSNTGGATTDIAANTITGFTITPPSPQVLPTGGTASSTVSLNTGTNGTFSGNLVYTGNPGGVTTAAIVVSGTVGNASFDGTNSSTMFGAPLSTLVAATANLTSANFESNSINATVTGGGPIKVGTTATILRYDNSSGGAETVSMAWRSRTVAEADLVNNPKALLSDVVRVTGMGAANTNVGTFVLTMSYDLDQPQFAGLNETAISLSGELQLGWFNSNTNQWTNAVNGNIGGTATFAGIGAPTGSTPLGTWGIDTSGTNGTGYVWAVLNHNSDFAVIPEPSTLVLGGLTLLGFASASLRRRRQRHAGQ